jgi:hypothetical protein
MKPLNPEARAILSASEHEQGPSPEVLGRMRTSVLTRVAAGGAVLVGTSVSAKAGAALGGTLAQVIGSGLAGAFAAAALVTVSQVWPEGGSGSLVARSAPVDTARVPRIVAESRPAEPQARSQERTAPTPEALPVRMPRQDPEPASQPPAPAEWKAPLRPVTSSKPEMMRPSEGVAGPLTSGVAAERATSTRLAPPPATIAAPLAGLDVPAREAPPPGIAPSVPSDQPPSKDHLSAQLQLLRTVRALLRDQQPHRVLDLLGPPTALAEGPFEEELRTARIASLCRLGRQSEARQEIDAFLKRWPGSPLAERLRAGCSVQ